MSKPKPPFATATIRRRGSVLLTGLFIVMITGILLAGAITLVTSHNVRVNREADYAAALQTAEAGVNWELWYVSRNQDSTIVPPAHTISNPYTGIVPGYTGVFQVYVSNADDPTKAWAPPARMTVTSTGTIGGISRTVQVLGSKQTIFSEFSVFGINKVDIGGSGSGVDGTLGTNGVLSSSSTGTGAVTMSVTYAGADASGPTGNNVIYEPDPVDWPTVDEIVSKTFPSGWASLSNTSSTYRHNNRMRQLASVGVNTAALTPSNTANLGWNGIEVLNTNTLKNLRTSSDGFLTLIFPPGDYYIRSIDLAGKYRMVFDTGGVTVNTGPGQVRLWMPDVAKSGDKMNVDLFMTSTDRSLFRLYYNKTGGMDMQGSSTWQGCFYGVRADGNAEVKLSGGSVIQGSVIADSVVISGGTRIVYPMDADIGNVNDYSLWYGFKDRYVEIAHGGSSAVFADGSSN